MTKTQQTSYTPLLIKVVEFEVEKGYAGSEGNLGSKLDNMENADFNFPG